MPQYEVTVTFLLEADDHEQAWESAIADCFIMDKGCAPEALKLGEVTNVEG